ncbi:MAG: hypothetical protein KGJ88_01570 [Verrucomicrobiota bacterium]|nr:hypothetical protein [Verrucomicrobiota bacterium]
MTGPPTIQPPAQRNQRNIDTDHLDLLAVFHFIGAGLAVLGIFFLIMHFTAFHILMSHAQAWQNQSQMPVSPAELFAIFQVFYLFVGAWFLASAVLNLVSGLFIRARQHRTFSLVVAGLNCLHIPLGTILGVFTIIVLLRDSVRELYDAASTGATL